ncbi:MAG: DUF4199 domain-containing protein [Prevotella sp.]|nr:DUF4199 domain-containing protein [Prevotella sp.]
MTPEEYIQLKAFARQDGALLALVWIGSFACYIQGFSSGMLGWLAIVLAVVSPFFVLRRLRHFRDAARSGIVSFGRGYAYSVLVFFYGGLLLAIAQYVYLAYLDNGYLLDRLMQFASSAEGRQMLQQMGMEQEMSQSLEAMGTVRPIDYALSILSLNITAGFILSLPIALAVRRKER